MNLFSNKKSTKTDRLLLGLGWLWSRPTPSDSGEPLDLETIDAWRRGLVSAERGKEVMRQLANDPRLMRKLEELVVADELIREFDASSKEHGNKHNLLLTIRKWVAETLASLKFMVLARGLAASAVAAVLMVVVLPYLTSPNSSQSSPNLSQTSTSSSLQLDSLYASLDEPSKLLKVPWTPKLSLRSGAGGKKATGETKLNELLGKAFQSGMAEGISRIESRFPDVRLNRGYVSSDKPACHLDITQCEQQVELAKMSGGWAVAAFLDCNNPSKNKNLETFALLTNLQQAWRDSNYENALSKDIQKIRPDGLLCQTVEELLVNWGQPKI